MNTQSTIATRGRVLSLADRHSAAGSLLPSVAAPARSDADFAALWQGLQRSGGLVGVDQLAGMMSHCTMQPISQLARWIVARHVVSVLWRGQTLLPLFQFCERQSGLRPGLVAVMLELAEVFDDWDLALWFARGNSGLGGAAPADLIATRPVEVWETARTDRFIAVGD